MPEGPELRFMAAFVNRVASERTFFVALSRSELATHPRKHPDITLPPAWKRFALEAEARGKEMRVHLRPLREALQRGVAGKRSDRSKAEKKVESDEGVTVLFRAGMSGNFVYVAPGDEIPKHAHLRFHDHEGGLLCFIDYRRFGSWQVTSDWAVGAPRSPCIMTEFGSFCRNLRDNLAHPNFDRPIGEILVMPRWANGSGNYIRAEALHRAGVNPFSRARDVLEPIFTSPDFEAQADLLQAQTAALEAVAIERVTPFFDAAGDADALAALETLVPPVPTEYAKPLGVLGTLAEVCAESYEILRRFGFGGCGGDGDHITVFNAWLQCYSKLDNARDDIGRTMWFHPDTPVVGKAVFPKGGMKRVGARSGSSKRGGGDSSQSEDASTPSPKKKKTPLGAPLTAGAMRGRSLAQDMLASAVKQEVTDEPAALVGSPGRARSKASPAKAKKAASVKVKVEAVEGSVASVAAETSPVRRTRRTAAKRT